MRNGFFMQRFLLTFECRTNFDLSMRFNFINFHSFLLQRQNFQTAEARGERKNSLNKRISLALVRLGANQIAGRETSACTK